MEATDCSSFVTRMNLVFPSTMISQGGTVNLKQSTDTAPRLLLLKTTYENVRKGMDESAQTN